MKMIEISAAQMIFSNVEEDRSPKGVRGFQTLFYTLDALNEDEVRQIETRLTYKISDKAPVKKIFFNTDSGKIVLASMIPLAELDSAGRHGRVFAHVLIIEKNEFINSAVNPLRLLNDYRFLISVENAMDLGDFETGNIPAVTIPVVSGSDDETLNVAQSIQVDEMKKILYVAMQAEKMKNEKSSVVVRGEPSQVEQILKAALFAVPSVKRSHCSFDTYSHDYNPMYTHYWAVGLTESAGFLPYAQIDAETKTVKGDIQTEAETAYLRWAFSVISNAQMTLIDNFLEYSYTLCEWLEGRTIDETLLDSIPDEVSQSVFNVNTRYVHSKLKSTLEKTFHTILVDRAFETVIDRIPQSQMLNHLRYGFDDDFLTDTLFQVYEQNNFMTPSDEEIMQLGKLLQRSKHTLLLLIYLCWSRRIHKQKLILTRLDEEKYKWLIKTVISSRLLNPLDLLVKPKTDEFMEIYLSMTRGISENFVEIVEYLVERKFSNALLHLEQFIPSLPEQDIRKLKKITNKYFDLPQSFVRAVNNKFATLPSRRSITGILKNFLSGGDKNSQD